MTYGRLPKTQFRNILATLLARDFSKKIRDRGASYFSLGRVKIVRGTDIQLEASVTGSENYQVRFDWQEDTLFASCACPYFAGGEPCKHLWATILAADAGGYLSVPASDPDLYVEFDSFESEVEDFEKEEEKGPSSPRHYPLKMPPPPPEPPAWQTQIEGIAQMRAARTDTHLNWTAARQILYVVDLSLNHRTDGIVISALTRDLKADGTWKPHVSLLLKREQIAQLPSAEDREILSLMAGVVPYFSWGYSGSEERISGSFVVPHSLAGKVVASLAQAGRLYVQIRAGSDTLSSLAWDDGEPWRFGLKLHRSKKGGWEVAGKLGRDSDEIKLDDVLLASIGGLLFTRNRVAQLAGDTPFEFLFHLQQAGPIHAPEQELDGLLGALLTFPALPFLELPADLQIETVSPTPRPFLRIHPIKDPGRASEKLQANLSFDYDGRQISDHHQGRGFYLAEARRFIERHAETEAAAATLLGELGAKHLKPTYYDPLPKWLVAPAKLPRMVRTLVEAGWHIEADGKLFRRHGAFKLEVSSGVDWFELHGNVEYGESSARLPELLEALRRGESMVRLDDGTYGVLPEQWLNRFGLLAELGTPDDGHIRFRSSQAGLLDALLASQPEASCDDTFTRVRQELGQFQGVKAALQPEGFVGRLRDYQREGLGWMEFLRRFSFGGCLADDMGVGKTAQVLALLEARRTERTERTAGAPAMPSLIVVPRSLIFNWKQEAERFTPQLRVLDYTGLGRDGYSLADFDLVLTTYGTLRRDAVHLKDVEFDYVVLDEAQAIKNAATEAAKAVRLLRGNHRLALSGTPVENHLGELWSLFEFLNPGMLGRASVFKLTAGAGRNPDEETRLLLAQALRPFILRRTKAQVAPELPAKTEQTIYCELEASQRKLYDELRQHYRDSLLQRIKVEGLAKSKIMVLEALLRLRQAACHPGLIDPKRVKEKSAKLDILLEQLCEVLDEGHKALVFSQFTSLLAIVRERLDSDGVIYEYLDGSTRDRQARVGRFQNDADCGLFLISLKAGGLGLNLTAAEYVFLLDPWWNPAVEAQAIDRAHRIGQARQVFAYRLIARDTVEEKVLELQKTKRDLAAAIIGGDNSLIRNLRREDLELLLS
jgi:hypothetical protein